jgi:hypothetical protein
MPPYEPERGCVATAPVQILLKNSTTAISATAFDKRSTDDTAVLLGLKDEVIVIPRANIAAIIMDADAAQEYFGS